MTTPLVIMSMTGMCRVGEWISVDHWTRNGIGKRGRRYQSQVEGLLTLCFLIFGTPSPGAASRKACMRLLRRVYPKFLQVRRLDQVREAHQEAG